MQTIAEQLTDLVRHAAHAAGYADAPVPLEPCVPAGDARHGDYQSNYAFRLGKALRTNPRAVAQALVDALPANDLLASAEVAGPGFLNLRLDDVWLGREVALRAASERLGVGQPGAGKLMVIDYSSPNIAKRMHVGHLRSTIIGNALHRLYAFLGWRVIADNHIGDWGTQFGKLIVAWRSWRHELDDVETDPIGALQWLYQQFGQRAEADPSLQEQARVETVKLQQGDPENRALWERFCGISMREFDALYQRLGVSFDVTHGESYYRDELDELIARLIALGVAEVEPAEQGPGPVLVRFNPEDGKGLVKNPLLIRKSDGAALYATTDLATIEDRVAKWDPDRIVYVTDVRQQLHFRQFFAAARKAKMLRDATSLHHIWFGMLRFSDGAVMASRSGQTVNLVDLLNTAHARARAIVDASSSAAELSEAEKEHIAEAVGVGAIRYQDLSQNPQTDLAFDWDKMLAMEGNTAPYLMYAHARCHSIFRKAGSFEPADEVWLTDPTERDLALLICRTPEVLEAAADLWRPNLVADHMFAISAAFGRFYAQCPVLRADNDTVRDARLTLTLASARALGVGLDLLGLVALERM